MFKLYPFPVNHLQGRMIQMIHEFIFGHLCKFHKSGQVKYFHFLFRPRLPVGMVSFRRVLGAAANGVDTRLGEVS